jgi:hypothetical protein
LAQNAWFHGLYLEGMEQASSANQNPLTKLHIKLSRTAKALKVWARTLIPQGRIIMYVYREVIDQLERAQEARLLSEGERNLLKLLKVRLIGLAAIEK